MTSSNITIKCPECGHEFDISDVLYDQVEHDLKAQYEARLKAERDRFRAQSEKLAGEREQLEKAREEQRDAVQRAIREGLAKERDALRRKISAEVQEEESARLKSLQEELDRKSEQVKEFHKAQAEIERLKRAMDEADSKAEADAQRKLNEMLTAEREKIHKDEEERQTLKIREKDHLIEQLKKQMADMQRKAEQGSMQVQGEVQETAIEEWLAGAYPLDTVEGRLVIVIARVADDDAVVQHVRQPGHIVRQVAGPDQQQQPGRPEHLLQTVLVVAKLVRR
mgnify:CR=1 FL=1